MTAAGWREAYSATGGTWQGGPGPIYDRLAAALVERCPGGVAGRWVLDLGAGTGAASRAATAAGAAGVVAVDAAVGMLAASAAARPPAAAGDALALPLADGCFGAVVAAFSLNHLTVPAAGLAEAARVLATGGGLAASAYAVDDPHPAKLVVDAACLRHGWKPEPWYDEFRADAVPRLATVEAANEAAAGLPGATADRMTVAFPELTPRQLVEWRLGLAQVSTFVARLTEANRTALVTDALDALGPKPPVLVRSFIAITWTKPA